MAGLVIELKKDADGLLELVEKPEPINVQFAQNSDIGRVFKFSRDGMTMRSGGEAPNA